MFWTIRFILFWLAWLVLADKTRWKEMLPTCILAALLGSLTDVLIHYYPLWAYDSTVWAELSDDLSVYPVVVYLFLQWLPKTGGKLALIRYWLYWTTFAITVEWLHVSTDHMSYPNGHWSMVHSYVSDWILFYVFYRFHKM